MCVLLSHGRWGVTGAWPDAADSQYRRVGSVPHGALAGSISVEYPLVATQT